MNLTIIIPFRPTVGGMVAMPGPITQDEKGNWIAPKVNHAADSAGERVKSLGLPEKTIRVINKNSFFKHKIIIGVDEDVTPNKDWLKEFDNVTVFKSKVVHPIRTVAVEYFRLNSLQNEIVMSLPDDEMICYAYIADLMCSKNWDKYIAEEYVKYGDQSVYLPLFVETRHMDLPYNSQLTGNNIWNEWRKICCHCLYLPVENHIEDVTEKMYDEWIAAATNPIFNNGCIRENSGARVYTYWCAICGRASKIKKAMSGINIGPGWDLDVESKLGTKTVPTKSFVLHVHQKFILDDIEVPHV